MLQSKLFFKTRKEVPADADSINASYLIRAGFIEKLMAGVYALLPLGYRVITKIEQVVREELNAIGGQEILMNVLQPKELWDETGRWEEGKEVMYQFKDIRDKELGLGWTHEEQLVDIVRKAVKSYKDLPIALYQIQTKFRNEPRAKSGLLRGREFLMKDMYSFHADEADCEAYYEKVKTAYSKIFTRLGFDIKVTAASGGLISNQKSHEFHVLAPAGEDKIFYCEKCDFSANAEVAEVKAGDKCPECSGEIKEGTAIELGHIFHLKTKYSEPMKANFIDSDGQSRPMIMGCYGIGLTRVMAAAVEIFYDTAKNKMNWPKEMAPFDVHLISLGKNKEADVVYRELREQRVEVLLDDRDLSAGEKFAEADLVGAPVRLIISEKSLASGGVEMVFNQETEKLSTGEVVDKVIHNLDNIEDDSIVK